MRERPQFYAEPGPREFYVTFGQQYRREQHPRSVNGVSPHPDGWMVVEARNMEEATTIAKFAFTDRFSMVYDRKPAVEWYPRGELGRIQ